MKIKLPWPRKELSPNRPIHWGAKYRITKAARSDAYHVTWIAARPTGYVAPEGVIFLRITATPPIKRRRDDDNLIAQLKSARDGIADALKINDNRFSTLPVIWMPPAQPGKVEIELLSKEEI